MWDREADVIIVGFGGAGAAAALAAVEAGADVLLVEKNPEGGGNTRYSGGSIRTYTNLDKAVDFIEAVCEGTTEREVVSTFVTESSRNQDWVAVGRRNGPRPAIGNQGISDRSSGSCLSLYSGR